MLSVNRWLPVVATIACTVIGTFTDAAEPLTYKWAEGESYRYQTTQTTRMQMNAGPAGAVETTSRLDTGMRWDVESVDEDGAATIRQGVERIVMKTAGPYGQANEYDSDSEAPPEGMAALIAPLYEALIEHGVIVRMAATGEVLEVTLPPELEDAINRMPGGAMSAEMVKSMASQGTMSFPNGKIEPGDTWDSEQRMTSPMMGVMLVRTEYTYRGPKDEGGVTYEAITPSVSVETPEAGPDAKVTIESGPSTGEALFDRDAGRLHRSRLNQQMKVINQAMGQRIESDITQRVTLRALGPDEPLDLTDVAEDIDGADGADGAESMAEEAEPAAAR